MKDRSDPLKRDNLFIHKEDKRHENPSYTAVASSILFLLTCEPCTSQSLKMRLQQLNFIIYYGWIIRATTTIDYWIYVYALSMLEETYINSL